MPVYQVNNLKDRFKNFLKDKYNCLDEVSMSQLRFGIVLVGDDFSSIKYAQMKLSLASDLGIKTVFYHSEPDVSKIQIQNILEDYEVNKGGLLFQLPIRSDLIEFVYNTPISSDVDLLSDGKEKLLKRAFFPPTIGAIDLILKDILKSNSTDFELSLNTKLNLKGVVVAIIGQGVLVGSPLFRYLTQSEATIISINIDTINPQHLTKEADILISATGKANLIDKTWLKKSFQKDNVTYPIVIDAGTSEGKVYTEDQTAVSKLVGDVDKESVQDFCTLVGVPGGVGPITVRYIFWNLYRLNQL